MKRRISAFLLALLTILMTACSTATSTETDTPEAEVTEPGAQSEMTEETEEPDPFEGADYDGRTFCIYTSVNEATVGVETSNYLIEGYEELTGDVAPDAAIQRNQDVEQRLNVELTYEDVNYSYDQVAANVRRLLSAGDATYQLIINDIYGLVPITPEGLFRNAYDGENFDFSRPWWYDDFMEDISINTKLRFTLAGDYFIDLLRCTHCLIMNKNIYTDIWGDPNDVYSFVLEKTWTFDKYRELIDGAYRDLNGNGKKDKNDQFGHIAFEYWGPMIPWIVSGDPDFIERLEDGNPRVALENEKSIELTERLNAIIHSDATAIGIFGSEQGTIDAFTSGQSLFIGYQRLGSLESDNLRSTEVDLAVLPYPMLNEVQADYVTSTHDTAELGFIPVSVTQEDMPFVSAVIEVLCRETHRQLLPAYYESSLKIKYTRDSMDGQMIDIIHDHYGNGFALAWSNALNGVLLNKTFNACVEANSTDFMSRFKTQAKATDKMLSKIIDKNDALLEQYGY